LILELPMLNEIFYEEMKDCVVGCGNGAAHMRRSLVLVTSGSQVPRVIQKFVS
jgi:hypothetical protein